MYEDNEKKIDWLNVIKKVLTVIAVLLIIFLIVVGVTKCSNNSKHTNNNKIPTIIVNLDDELDKLESAAIKYITKEDLPKTINSQRTIKLKYLIDNNVIEGLVDESGNVCDVNKSYVEITKLENNYAVKTYIISGDKSDYKISYIGCFDSCVDGEICLGSENTTGGICETENNLTETDKKPTENNKPSTGTTQKPSNNNSTSSSLRLMYEFKRYKSSCPANYSYDSITNSCVSLSNKTYIGTVVPESTQTRVDVKYFNSTSKLISEGYTFAGIDENGLGNKGVKTITTVTKAYCEDSSYTYNSETNTCSKTVLVSDYKPLEGTWEYTWSYSPTLIGWTRTGVTKYK